LNLPVCPSRDQGKKTGAAKLKENLPV
jgi:hypothetical protein